MTARALSRSTRTTRTTRTMEQAQVAQLNERLGTAGSALGPQDLGLDGPPDRTLSEVRLEGSPSFGYVWGLFRVAGGGLVRVRLHTEELRRVSAALGLLQHHWDV